MAKVKKGVFSFSHKIWNNISSEAKSLICKMLVKDPSMRYSAQECL